MIFGNILQLIIYGLVLLSLLCLTFATLENNPDHLRALLQVALVCAVLIGLALMGIMMIDEGSGILSTDISPGSGRPA